MSVLFCTQHQAVHRIAPSDAERVVYALQAVVVDASAGEFVFAQEMCPLELLEASHGDYEGHVDAMVANRRAAARTHAAIADSDRDRELGIDPLTQY